VINKNKILKSIFLTGLLIAPFIYNPFAPIPYEIPKVVFVKVWIEILLFLAIIFTTNESVKKVNSWNAFLLLAFAAWAIFTSFTGSDVNKSWVGNYYRRDGLISFLHLISVTFFIWFYATKDWRDSFLKIIGFSGILLSVLSVGEWILINIFGKYSLTTWLDDGIGLSFGNPNFLVGYLLLCLPAYVYVFNNLAILKNRLTRFLIWALVIMAIIFTKAWVGIAGVCLFFVLLFFLGQKAERLKIAGVCALVLLSIGTAFFYQHGLFENMFGHFGGVNTRDNNGVLVAESRGRIYTKGLLAFFKRPIVGYGWSNFDHAFESVDWPMHYEHDVYVDKAHMAILEVLVGTGIFGLFLYLAIILKTLANFWIDRNANGFYFLLTFLILIIHMQTNVVSISEEVIFWILVGFASINRN
jgi:O-antigen ligase